ncbi:hypothetical protein V6N12_041722 [Hibiscus sabdariffa]|uniref:RING-type E3 ubiquitin transferase n=1 Tax=Hibiscus sabdariffa TaxID=183260 RepID=A0ABR2A297_9ROSI
MEEVKGELVQSLIDAVNQIAPIGDYRCAVKKEFCNLARRLKLLTPMFEEIRESKQQIPEETVKALVSLKEALISAKELLRFGSEGSKIYLVLERDQIMHKFHEVTARVEQALSGIPYDNLDISDEVKEQVELVLAQFRRAKGRVDAADVELYEDLLSLYNKSSDVAADQDVLRRLAEKLQLVGIAELTQESLALHEMVSASCGDPGEAFEKMSNLLKKIKDFVQTENPNLDASARENNLPPSSSGQVTTDGNHKTPVIPDDFRCPISLELMKDPVIVSTGQTYERSCIEKWLEQVMELVQRPQQTLSSRALTPNYVLRSLIAQCPEDKEWLQVKSVFLPSEMQIIVWPLLKAGAIPLLVTLLSTPDSRTQEHAVTALLNLSICEDNKGSIISFGAVPGIVQNLEVEWWDEALAILAILSSHPEGKSRIGAAEAVACFGRCYWVMDLQGIERMQLQFWFTSVRRPTTFSRGPGTRSDGPFVGLGTEWRKLRPMLNSPSPSLSLRLINHSHPPWSRLCFRDEGWPINL